jgi:Leucine-rich repeat (LRR) protein
MALHLTRIAPSSTSGGEPSVHEFAQHGQQDCNWLALGTIWHRVFDYLPPNCEAHRVCRKIRDLYWQYQAQKIIVEARRIPVFGALLSSFIPTTINVSEKIVSPSGAITLMSELCPLTRASRSSLGRKKAKIFSEYELRLHPEKIHVLLEREYYRACCALRPLPLSSQMIAEQHSRRFSLIIPRSRKPASEGLLCRLSESLAAREVEYHYRRCTLREKVEEIRVLQAASPLQKIVFYQNWIQSLHCFPKEFVSPSLREVAVTGQGLRTFPSLDACVHLVSVNLAGNLLSAAPPGLADLRYLEEICLSLNRVSSFGFQLSCFSCLKVLDLSHNFLEAVGEEIGLMKRLSSLDLSHNRLTSLPPALGGCSALTFLNISDNSLHNLPLQIGSLALLERFIARNCELDKLPSTIGEMRSLRECELFGNRLSDLPPSMKGCRCLHKLDLSGNRFVSIPRQLEGLMALTELNMSLNFSLAEFPAEVLGGVALQKLIMDSGQTKVLEEDLERLTEMVRSLSIESFQLMLD